MSLESILDEERFEKRLRELAAKSPAEKRKHASRIRQREKRMVEDHAWWNREIPKIREVCDSLRREDDEMYSHDGE